MITASRMGCLSLLLPLWSIGCTVAGDDAQLPHGTHHDTPEIDLDDPVSVTDVIDGDTIEVDLDGTLTRVRFKGIDTPELNLSTGGPAEPWAEDARTYTAAHTGNVVQLEFDSDCSENPLAECRDAYDRLLAYVRISNGDDLNSLLLRQGLARVYRFMGEAFDRLDTYDEMQSEAQDDSLGIWSE
jgi:micrococcal nuclease